MTILRFFKKQLTLFPVSLSPLVFLFVLKQNLTIAGWSWIRDDPFAAASPSTGVATWPITPSFYFCIFKFSCGSSCCGQIAFLSTWYRSQFPLALVLTAFLAWDLLVVRPWQGYVETAGQLIVFGGQASVLLVQLMCWLSSWFWFLNIDEFLTLVPSTQVKR